MTASRMLPSLLTTCLFAIACSGPERSPTAPSAAAGATTASHPEPTVPPAAPPPETTMPDPRNVSTSSQPAGDAAAATKPATATATFGNGCFWCTEAVLEQLDGVIDVTSGFMGGTVDHPTYEQVCTGTTGHAEVVQVTFDPARISYDMLLDWFFRSHDPTTLNRQGADEGTQYRSVIFTHTPAQAEQARQKIAQLNPAFGNHIVTEVTPAAEFWSAEAYHQDYFRNHPGQGYCRAVIAPKLHKLGLDDTGKGGKPGK